MKTKSIVKDMRLPRRSNPPLVRRGWETLMMLKLTVERSIVRKGHAYRFAARTHTRVDVLVTNRILRSSCTAQIDRSRVSGLIVWLISVSMPFVGVVWRPSRTMLRKLAMENTGATWHRCRRSWQRACNGFRVESRILRQSRRESERIDLHISRLPRKRGVIGRNWRVSSVGFGRVLRLLRLRKLGSEESES